MDTTTNLLSAGTWTKLLRVFTRRGLEFFKLYQDLHDITEGVFPEEGNIPDRFRASVRITHRMLATDSAKNQFAEQTSQLRPLMLRFHSLLREGTFTPEAQTVLRRIILIYTELIPVVAMDRDVFLRGRVIAGRVPWVVFRIMSKKEKGTERLRKEDPELYDTVQQSKETLRKLDQKVEQAIVGFGMKPKKFPLMGRLENVGEDPVTGERFVFTLDGDLKPIDEYIQERKKTEKATRNLNRVFPTELDGLRSYTNEEVDELAEGQVRYTALTDDKVKQQDKAITRVYPVRQMDGKDVVVEGRFKGFMVDDLVNRMGRLIEGTAYDYDPKNNRPVPLENVLPDGSVSVRVSREPYVTLASDGKLLLSIPRTKQSKQGAGFTPQRNAAFELSKLIPSVEMLSKTGRSQYYFEAKDFAAVREAVSSLALSSAAMRHIRDYFTQLARHELALSEENLQHYQTEAIGGFQEGRTLYRKQREAMAWVESRGGSGVCALDTGVGKTSLSVGYIQKMRRDGALEDDKRVLYVCPPKLRGNLPREARKFLDNPAGFMDSVDVMSYPQLLNALRRDPRFADGYAAVIFDEAHFLKDPRSKTTQAVMGIRNPNKVLMTASPMTRSPVEVFTLAAVANNESLDSPEERVAFNARLRAFRKRFAAEIGGRIVGIKPDPTTAKDFRVWVKQNLYFADKTDVEEIVLPAIRKQTMVLTMEPEVEARYREATSGVSDVLRGMAAKFKLRSPDATDPMIEAAKFKLKGLFAELFRLASMPETVVPGARNPKMEQAEDLVEEKVGTSNRTILFTDSPELAELTVKRMSLRFPGKLHAVGLADSIQVWQDGEMVKMYRARIYKDSEGKKHPKSEWQGVILNNIVGPNDEVLTCTLTKSYALGQNLQMFSSVIHLDRDDWNSEIMKQRTARVWRNGQQNSVDEVVLDAVYENPVDERDETLDRIVAYLQELEGELFERVVIESQTEALGSEFFGMKRLPSSLLSINRRMLELSLSPYLARSGAEDL